MKKLLLILLSILPILLFAADDDESEDTTESINSIATFTAIKIANQYPDYPATPGDIYDIFFLTSANINQTLTGFVDADYNIDLSFIGKVNVKGLIYTEVQQVLKDKVVKAYPSSIVNVAIKSTGRFKVTLIGEVNNAQIIDVMSLNTLSEVISGKTTNYASFRDIEIRSEDGSYNVYDLFQFNRYANKKHNPFLKPNDVITIRQFARSVKISGEVRRPGTYQLVPSDNLETVIDKYADGFTKLAEKNRIKIEKLLDESENFSDRNIIINIENQKLSLVNLDDFDKIYVPKLISYNSNVELLGNINTPGTYELEAGSTLFDVINIYGHGYNKLAEPKKIEIRRLIGDSSEYSEDSIYIDGTTEDLKAFLLNDFDIITIPSKRQFGAKVTFQGAISPKGEINEFNIDLGTSVSNKVDVNIIKGNRLSTVLEHMNGTFNVASDLENAYIIRGNINIEIDIAKIMSNENNDQNIIIEDRDIIIIPFKQQIVYIAGSVNESGAKPFIANRTAQYYIGLAGGPDREENLFGSFIIRDVNGNKRPKDSIIQPEDIIWVKRNHPMSYVTEYSGWFSTVLSVIYTGVLINSYL